MLKFHNWKMMKFHLHFKHKIWHWLLYILQRTVQNIPVIFFFCNFCDNEARDIKMYERSWKIIKSAINLFPSYNKLILIHKMQKNIIHCIILFSEPVWAFDNKIWNGSKCLFFKHYSNRAINPEISTFAVQICYTNKCFFYSY